MGEEQVSDILALLEAEGNTTRALGELSGLAIYPRSVVSDGGSVFFLGRQGITRRLGILMPSGAEPTFDLVRRSVAVGGEHLVLGLGDANHANASALRARVSFMAPVPVGMRKSFGLGDRLGIATPGHIRALRQTRGIFPVLAQQSIREMERAGRTPEQVMDSATWGVLQEGWWAGYGADADHIKTEADIDACAAAGFIGYTLDPRDHVDNAAQTDSLDTLALKFDALPWPRLATNPDAIRADYLGKEWNLGGGRSLTLGKEELLRAACKYGRALAHLSAIHRHLEQTMNGRRFEVEISVDETDTPTSPGEHLFMARELERLGVKWVNLAPRYVGRFEKGVDYIGDLGTFEAEFGWHVAIARALGPYKLSLHSGSDKFSIYPIMVRLAGDLVHVKTAGTSYLEALRTVARTDPGLFREILGLAIANYERDRVTYYVSAQLSKVPSPESLADEALPQVLDAFDARQALHVTFGTVLTAVDYNGDWLLRQRFFDSLETHEEAHYEALEAQMIRHIGPFSD